MTTLKIFIVHAISMIQEASMTMPYLLTSWDFWPPLFLNKNLHFIEWAAATKILCHQVYCSNYNVGQDYYQYMKE